VRRIPDIDFSPRTRHALAAAQIEFVGDLVQVPARELVRMPNFGRKSLTEVIEFLGADFDLGNQLRGWTRETAVELEQQFRAQLKEIRLVEILSKIEQTGPMHSLDDQLRGVAKLCYKDQRSVDIALSFYGWDGAGSKTLEAVGQRVGITRERVRQITSRLADYFEGRHIDIPWLEKASNKIAELVPASSSEIEFELSRAGITKGSFRLSGILSALRIISGVVPFATNTLNGVELVTSASQSTLPRRVLQVARRIAAARGCCNLGEVTEEIEKEHRAACSDEFVAAVLQMDPGYRPLDDEWFWFVDQSRNRLLYQLAKIFAVAPRIRLGELRTALSRNHQMAGFSPPRRVLGNLVAQLPNCKVEDGLAIATSLPPSDVLSNLELKFYEVFKHNGDILTRDRLEGELLGAGVNYASFYMYLSYCSIITRVATGIYALVGAPISPGLIDEAAAQRVSRKTFLGSGWCKGGEVWLAYELGYASIASGSFSVPSAIKNLLQGDYALNSEDGGEFGTATVRETFLSGLGKFFRRRGAEPGEHLVLVVNLQAKTVTARIGDASLVEHYERGETPLEWREDLDRSPECDPVCDEPAPMEPVSNADDANSDHTTGAEKTIWNWAPLKWLDQRVGSFLETPRRRRIAGGSEQTASPPVRGRSFPEADEGDGPI
jgi:hypothetical protein